MDMPGAFAPGSSPAVLLQVMVVAFVPFSKKASLQWASSLDPFGSAHGLGISRIAGRCSGDCSYVPFTIHNGL